MNRVDWLRRQFSSSGVNSRDWQLGYDDGLAGHRQHLSDALDAAVYKKGWVEGNAAILQVTVAIQTGLQPQKDRRSALASKDRRVGDRRGAERHQVSGNGLSSSA